jgi:hypothetical protein
MEASLVPMYMAAVPGPEMTSHVLLVPMLTRLQPREASCVCLVLIGYI